MMRVGLVTVVISIALVAGSVACSAEQKNASSHHSRITRHHNVVHPGRAITSFSSSSVLHVGVNHPPKNR
jgi:hypothetical protein